MGDNMNKINLPIIAGGMEYNDVLPIHTLFNKMVL